VRPISGGYTPAPGDLPFRRPAGGAGRPVPVRSLYPVAPPPALREIPGADVEVEIRLFADGGSITVRRSIVDGPDGGRQTVGIDALIR
jgi:hypothetical protein